MTTQPPSAGQHERHPLQRGREWVQSALYLLRDRAARWAINHISPGDLDEQTQRRQLECDRFGAEETEESGRVESGPAETAATLLNRPDVPRGTTPEKFAIALLRANDGQLPWRVLKDELGWSDSASRRILDNLQERGCIGVSTDGENRKIVFLREDVPVTATAE